VPAHTTSYGADPRDDVAATGHDGPRLLAILGIRHHRAHGGVGLACRPGDEQAVSAGVDTAGDGRNLCGGFAAAEDHLRKALTEMPVRVHAREAQVVERRRAHGVLNPPRGVGRRHRSGPNLFKKRV
jgi:hypothetical protein